jgi:hypothetical protein
MSIVSFAHTNWFACAGDDLDRGRSGNQGPVPPAALSERILVAHLHGERKLVRGAVGDVDEAEPMGLPAAGDLGQLDEHDRRERGRRGAGEGATDDGDAVAHQLGGRFDLDVHGQGRAGDVEIEHEVAGRLAEVRIEADGER